MLTKLQKVKEGFTIVEVLIVLAIAALILAIILIAVPDLQRSSRNTNIYHDAQNVVSAINTYEGDNQGAVPGYIPPVTGSTVKICLTNPCNATEVPATVHVQSNDNISFGPAPGGPLAQGTIVAVQNAVCPNSGGSSNRSVAVYYPVEGSSANVNNCVQA